MRFTFIAFGPGWLYATAPFAGAAEPLQVGQTRQLFFDDHAVASISGLQRGSLYAFQFGGESR